MTRRRSVRRRADSSAVRPADAVRPHLARVVCLATPAALVHRGSHYPPADEIGDDALCRLLPSGVAAYAGEWVAALTTRLHKERAQ